MKKLIFLIFAFALSASPVLAQFTLTVTAFGNGSVNVSPAPDLNGGTQYTIGTKVMLVALPADLWQLDYFESGAFTLSADTVTFNMNQNRDVNVYFVKGKLLYFRDESLAMSALAVQTRALFEQVDKVVYSGEEIILNDSTTITAPFDALGGANLTLIRDQLVANLNLIISKADTLKTIAQQ